MFANTEFMLLHNFQYLLYKKDLLIPRTEALISLLFIYFYNPNMAYKFSRLLLNQFESARRMLAARLRLLHPRETDASLKETG